MEKADLIKNIIYIIAVLIAAILSYVFVLLDLLIIAIILWTMIGLLAILLMILKHLKFEGGCAPLVLLLVGVALIILTINTGML